MGVPKFGVLPSADEHIYEAPQLQTLAFSRYLCCLLMVLAESLCEPASLIWPLLQFSVPELRRCFCYSLAASRRGTETICCTCAPSHTLLICVFVAHTVYCRVRLDATGCMQVDLREKMQQVHLWFSGSGVTRMFSPSLCESASKATTRCRIDRIFQMISVVGCHVDNCLILLLLNY